MTPIDNAAPDLPALADDPAADAIAEIEGLMADRHSSYWKGPKAEKMQARYRALVGTREAAGSGFPAVHAAPRGGGEPPSPAARALAGDEYGPLVAGEIEAAFGDSAGEVDSVIAGLPDGLRAAMADEISEAYLPRQRDASRDDLAAFEGTSAGKILVHQWGDQTPRRLAIAMKRMERMEEGLKPGEMKEWQHFWHRGLDAAHRAAIIDRLTK